MEEKTEGLFNDCYSTLFLFKFNIRREILKLLSKGVESDKVEELDEEMKCALDKSEKWLKNQREWIASYNLNNYNYAEIAGEDVKVTLNVGGKIFQVNRRTLLSCKSLYFTTLLRFAPKLDRCGNLSYFIDRDGNFFEWIYKLLTNYEGAFIDIDNILKLSSQEKKILQLEIDFFLLNNIVKNVIPVIDAITKKDTIISGNKNLMNPSSLSASTGGVSSSLNQTLFRNRRVHYSSNGKKSTTNIF